MLRLRFALTVLLLGAAACSQRAAIPQMTPEMLAVQAGQMQPPGPDVGGFPMAPPIMVGNVLYGTTVNRAKHGYGALYGLTSKDNAFVVHAFRSVSSVQTILTDFNGALYGDTANGGAHGYGGVFGVDPSTGKQTLFYSFQGGSDARQPGNLNHAGGLLYGTSNEGGADGFGTIFSIDPSTGKESIVYDFPGGSYEEAYPMPSLVNIRGVLYGMTEYGTIFRFNPATGREDTVTTLFSASNNVVAIGDMLYFQYSPEGTYNQIYQLDPRTGAYGPVCSAPNGYPVQLVVADGILYSATQRGGTYGHGGLYKFNFKQGTYYPVHEFSSLLQISNHEITYAHGAFYGIGVGDTKVFVVQFGKGYEKRLYGFRF